MPIIPRTERTEDINPTPLRSVDMGSEAIGQGLQRLGHSMGDMSQHLEREAKKRDELDLFETKMKLTRFMGDQEIRQREYDAGISGSGRDHTLERLGEYDQAAGNVLSTLPNNKKAQQFAQLHLAQARAKYGEQSYVAQTNHINVFKETELGNTAFTLVPNVRGDKESVEKTLAQLEIMLGGVQLPEAAKQRVRIQAVGLIAERFREQTGIDGRAVADEIIRGYMAKTAKETADVSAPLAIEGAQDDPATVGKHVLIPTIGPDGKKLSEADAITQYAKTKKHMGVFDTPEEAAAQAKKIAEDQAKQPGAQRIEKGADLAHLVSIHKGLLTKNRDKNIDELSRPFVTALGRMLNEMPPELRAAIEINEAHRSLEYQDQLHRKHLQGGPLAAPPGKSRHNQGEAIDLSPRGGDWKNQTPEYKAAIQWIYDNGERYGIENPRSIRGQDPAHFELKAGTPAGEPAVVRPRRDTVEMRGPDGEPIKVPVDMTRSEGLFIRQLIHDLDKIDKRVEKFALEDAAANQVRRWVEGYLAPDAEGNVRRVYDPFNGHDDKSRKLVNTAFRKTELSERLFRGDPQALQMAVLVSQRLNFTPEPVAEALHGMISQKDDPALRERGYAAAASILDRTPFAMDATAGAEKVRKQALEWTALVRGQGLSGADAVKRIDEFDSPEWAKLQSVRAKEAKEIEETLGTGELRAALEDQYHLLVWFTPGLQGIGGQEAFILSDWKKAVVEHYTRNGDVNLAKKMAAGEISRTWGASNVTGAPRVTKWPADSKVNKIFPEINDDPRGGHAWIKDDLLGSVNDWLKAQKKEPITESQMADRVAYWADAQTDREIKESKAREPNLPPQPSYIVMYKESAERPFERVMMISKEGTLVNRWQPSFLAEALKFEKAREKERSRIKTEHEKAIGRIKEREKESSTPRSPVPDWLLEQQERAKRERSEP